MVIAIFTGKGHSENSFEISPASDIVKKKKKKSLTYGVGGQGPTATVLHIELR